MKRLTNKQIADNLGCHIDTIFKYKRRAISPSLEIAKKAEELFGIDRLRFLYPDEYGDPWTEPIHLKNASPPIDSNHEMFL